MDYVHLEGEGHIPVGVLRAPVVNGAPVEMQLRESKSVSWSGKTAAGEGGRAGRVAALEGEGDFGGVTVVRDVGRQRLQIRKMTAKLVVDFEVSVIGLLMILFLRT